jgi:hypothetical protein
VGLEEKKLMVTLDQAIDTAMQLPPEQREMLVEILRNRQIEARREEIAHDAEESLAAFRDGKIVPQSTSKVIEELRQALGFSLP